MKYIKIYENFNNYDINYWMDEMDELDNPELYNKKNVKELINRVENFEYPFDVYLLDDENWTSDILNYSISRDVIKKTTIEKKEDINIEQTIRGRLLELDHQDYMKSCYVSINKDLPISKLSINIEEDLTNFLLELNDLNINTSISLTTTPWSIDGETIYYNLISIHVNSSFRFLPIGETISALSRIESYINRIGFSSQRPTPIKGKILNNIAISLENMIDDYLSLTELIKKSNSFAVNFPFNQLIVNYYKRVN